MKEKTGNEEKARLAGIVDRDTLSHIRREKGEEEERSQAPLSFRVIRRLFRFAQPHRPLLMGTLAMVILRALQMPVLAWAVGAIGWVSSSSTRKRPQPRVRSGAISMTSCASTCSASMPSCGPRNPLVQLYSRRAPARPSHMPFMK